MIRKLRKIGDLPVEGKSGNRYVFCKFHSLVHEVNDYMLEICFGLPKLQAKVSSERRVRKGILFKQNCSFISINARGDIFAQWLEYIILFKRPVERDSIDKLILNQKLFDNTLVSPHLTLSVRKKKNTQAWADPT